MLLTGLSGCKNDPLTSPGTGALAPSGDEFVTQLFVRDVNYTEGADFFSVVQLTDLHLGEELDYPHDYDYAVAPPEGSDGLAADYLRSIVEWINANKAAYDIRLVIVTGDITDTAAYWQFVKAKEILDQLDIPYVPMMGNHDVWPKGNASVAAVAVGDTYFREVFGSVFSSLAGNPVFDDWDDGTRNSAVSNPTCACDNYYQNFSFSHDGYYFLCSDFNARYLSDVEYEGIVYYTGAGVRGELTYTWDNWFMAEYDRLQTEVLTAPDKDRILVFSHIPAVTWAHPTTGYHYGFEDSDLQTITEFLYNDGNGDDTGLWAGGHFHTGTAYEYYLGVVTQGLQFVCPQIIAQTSQAGKIQLIRLFTN